MPKLAAVIQRDHFKHMTAGKTARYPSADSAENRGMDSLISGLDMSINIRRISIEGTEEKKGRL